MIHQPEFCIGCRACQQACQDYHNLPAGKKLMEIVEQETFKDKTLHVSYVMHTCRQCGRALCMEACQRNAISRNEHGVVLIDGKKCDGCGSCEKACPSHAIIMLQNAEGKKAFKCMECIERRNGKSICEEACQLLCIRREYGQ